MSLELVSQARQAAQAARPCRAATLADARDYMLKRPDAIAVWQAWLLAAELLLAAAKYPTDDAIGEATDQLERALFLSYREDITARPP